eukprot:5499690-Prorocentrum_lima.AAC.1
MCPSISARRVESSQGCQQLWSKLDNIHGELHWWTPICWVAQETIDPPYQARGLESKHKGNATCHQGQRVQFTWQEVACSDTS